ncbi:MAG: AAA family ATPase [Armatimonadetes bacterium]|nr:AAA family ATPase [Armatimonadota bacterium]MBS1710364.1 AAA family ATPase [Armatimonadota bacterium]MBX3108999.1 AAA family ATPase [Fimbriimonadaceae bacterium]
MDAKREIEVLIRAKYPILWVTSWEERRVEEAIKEIAQKLNRQLHTWSVTQGMVPTVRRASGPVKATTLPGELEALAQIHESAEFTVFLLKDFHPYMKDTRVVRLLRDLAARLRGKAQTLILLSPQLALPTELEKDVTVLEYPLPGRDEISSQLDEVTQAMADTPNVDTALSPELRETIVRSAQGLTTDEIESALARALVEDRRLTVDKIIEEKKQIVRKTGMLEFYPSSNSMDDIGGHDLLKDWLLKRSKSFTDAARDFGIPYPKGILIIGVQGCGKSLVAKAVSSAYNLPMLKMDVGRIFGSLVGQSEQNMRRAISIAESLSPCVLWIDELEKGFAGMNGGVSDSGTTARVFSTFLTWMQEKTKPVFLIATGNNVAQLPPELMRKGRFDEIFFVDLPDTKEREEIFRIHLAKRKRDPKKFKVGELASITDGFSGAEIEQLVVGALNAAFFADREVTFKDIKFEADNQVPLSRMMSEDIAELREWARMRARPSAKYGEG